METGSMSSVGTMMHICLEIVLRQLQCFTDRSPDAEIEGESEREKHSDKPTFILACFGSLHAWPLSPEDFGMFNGIWPGEL
jgi:hypothetical protein